MVVNGEVIIEIPDDQFELILLELRKLVSKMDEIKFTLSNERRVGARFITAMEFMESVKIKRWKFNQFVGQNKIKAIKKERKIYVLATEVDRYFMDPNIG